MTNAFDVGGAVEAPGTLGGQLLGSATFLVGGALAGALVALPSRRRARRNAEA